MSTFASYIGHIRQADALTYEITLTDTRRVDLVTTFLEAAGLASQAILGTIGVESSTVEPNNPVFKVVAVDPTVGAVMLVYDSGLLPSSTGAGQTTAGQTVGSDGKAVTAHDDAFWAAIDGAALQVANTGQGFDYAGGIHYRAAFGLNIGTTFLLDGVAVDILDGSGNYLASYTPIGMQAQLSLSGSNPGSAVVNLQPFQPDAALFNGISIPQGAIIIPWALDQPTVGATFKLRLYAINATKIFTVAGHPIDLLTRWWLNVGIAYDASAAATVRHQLGDDLAVQYRFDLTGNADRTLYDVVQNTLTLPFGFSWRMNDAQQRVLFICRDLTLITNPGGIIGPSGPLSPAEILGVNDLRSAEASAFDLDERSIKNRVTVAWQQIRLWDANLDGGTRPPDGMVAVPQTAIQVDYSTNGGIALGGTPEPDSDIAGVKELRIDLPGFVGGIVFGAPPGTVAATDMTQWAIHTAVGIFNRVGRGAPLVTLQVVRGRSRADVGDIIATTADQVVNTYADLFPHSQRIREGGGSRLLQVVQRTITPEGPDLLCWDLAPGQGVTLVPTFTLAGDSTDPYHIADATLTNAQALAALGTGTQVVVQYAIASSAPTAGLAAGAIDPAAPTMFSLPPVSAGSQVWVRMAAVVPGRGTGGWSDWQTVTLTALPAPSSLGLAAQPNGTDVLLTWTPGSTTFPEAVYQDGVLLAVLPPGTSQFVVEGVSGSHTFTVRTVDAPPLMGQSSAASVTGAPTGGVTLTAPIDPAAFAGTHDATGLLVLDGTYGLEVTATAIPSTVQFEVALETAVGSGSYGTYVVQAQIAAVQGGRTRFTAKAAQNDGLRREIRAKSTRNGATDSAYTTAQVVNPWSQQTLPPAPPRLTPVWGAGTLAVLLQGDKTTVSFKIAASPSAYPTDATVRAATPINATNNQAATGALESGLVVNDLIYVSAFAYTQLAGGGTESAHAQAVFVYGGGAAPIDASYVTAVPESGLPNSRALTAVAPIILTDSGPGTTEEISLDTSSAGIGGSFLALVTHKEPILLGAQRYVTIPAFPSALTDLASIPGLTQLIHQWKDLSQAQKASVRLQAWIKSGLAGAKLALQYTDGSWHYYDGVSGPLVSLTSAGLVKGAYVPVVSGGLADREQRVVGLGGDDATEVVVGVALSEWAVSAANVDPTGGGTGGGSYGDCSVLASDDFEYVDTAAMTANGWVLHALDIGGVWTIDAAHVLSGSKALKFHVAGGRGLTYWQKTFGVADGLAPNTAYTFKCGIYVDPRPSAFDVDFYLQAGGNLSTGVGVAGSFVTQTAHATTDASGNVIVKLIRGPGFFGVNITTSAWYDQLQILNGSAC